MDLAGGATASVRNEEVKTLIKTEWLLSNLNMKPRLHIPDATAHPQAVGFSGSQQHPGWLYLA